LYPSILKIKAVTNKEGTTKIEGTRRKEVSIHGEI
jgi:hypothetical protein